MNNTSVCWIKLLVFLFLCSSVLSFSFCQQEEIDPKRGVTLGKILFYPSVLFGVEFNDNVFYRNSLQEEVLGLKKTSDTIYTIKPAFRFEFPFSHSYVKLTYSPQYRAFQDYELDEKLSHLLNLDSMLLFSNGMKVSFQENYTEGVLETETFDPGGEVVFGGEKFTYSTGFIGVSYDFAGLRGLEAKVSYDDLEFDRSKRSSFYDHNAKGIKASYYQNLSPRLTIVTDYSFRDFRQQIPLYDIDGNLIDTRDDDFNEYSVAVGFRGSLLKNMTGYAGLSYTKLDFLGPVVGSDFSGLTGEASLKSRLSNNLTLDFVLKRIPYQSYFLDNKYYLSNLLSVSGTYFLSKHTFCSLRGSYYLNKYQRSINVGIESFLAEYNGMKREDKLSRIDLVFNHLFTPLMGISAGYTFMKKETNMDIYAYDANRFIVQMGFGWF